MESPRLGGGCLSRLALAAASVTALRAVLMGGCPDIPHVDMPHAVGVARQPKVGRAAGQPPPFPRVSSTWHAYMLLPLRQPCSHGATPSLREPCSVVAQALCHTRR